MLVDICCRALDTTQSRAPAASAEAALRDDTVTCVAVGPQRVTTPPADREPTRAAGNEEAVLARFGGLTSGIHSHTQKKSYEQKPFLL